MEVILSSMILQAEMIAAGVVVKIRKCLKDRKVMEARRNMICLVPYCIDTPYGDRLVVVYTSRIHHIA